MVALPDGADSRTSSKLGCVCCPMCNTDSAAMVPAKDADLVVLDSTRKTRFFACHFQLPSAPLSLFGERLLVCVSIITTLPLALS